MVRPIASIGLALAIAFTPSVAFAQNSSRHATFLEMFSREQMTCGNKGWTFPGLLNGHVPLYACVLKFKNNAGVSPFGPL